MTMAPDALGPTEFLSPPPSAEAALAAVAEPARTWFRRHFGGPTLAQRLAWPAVAAGNNLLLSAPTGSGKTLAAFLPVLGELLAVPAAFGVRCLYVTPMKALGNDARKNLRSCVQGLRALRPEGWGVPRVGLRTGDTSSRLRRALWTQPPDLLLTTPESLAVLLSQPAAGDLFGGLRWVVVDEVHALAGSKRGCDLALSLERLADLAGGRPQRVGLSATCAPLEEAARFLAGAGWPCSVARVESDSPLSLRVEPLEGGFWRPLLDRLGPELERNRSTLVFTNARGLSERLAWALRQRYPAWEGQIAVHHSALAAARRRVVERQLKQGRLRCVVSSTSLELGIDVGTVDGVVLVHPPGDVVRLLQRVGRAGHEPGRTRRGLVLTASPAELLDAAVTAASGQSAQYEPLRVPDAPLDVLCQQLLGMAAQRDWPLDDAFALVRGAYPYRDLPRHDFDDCLAYLAGRGRDGDDWLPPRVSVFEGRFSIVDSRTARLLRRNLGTILAEEQRAVVLDSPAEDRQSTVGEVSEAFAERLQPGDRFLLDGRCLEFRRAEAGTLRVEEVAGRPAVPRWGGDGWPLSPELSRRLFLLRLRAAEALRDGPEALADLLRREYALDGRAVEELAAFVQRQECLSEVPDTTALLVEAVRKDTGADYYLHTPLNRSGNDALARVAVRRLARDLGVAATSLVADLGFAVFVRRPRDVEPDDWRALLAADGFDDDLAGALADSVALRERFRRVALTGLMLLRNPVGRRRRVGGGDWAERRLFEQLRAADPDFVFLRQARREVASEVCDAAAARAFAEGLPGRAVRCRWLPRPSPFVAGWTQAAAGPHEEVETPAEALQRLHGLLTGAPPDD